jgi:hypothetical protein
MPPDESGALYRRHLRDLEEPCSMRRPTCLSFSARRSSLRTAAILIARAPRITN